jgi:hypothetical protein
MTFEEWRADVTLAVELKKILQLPVLKAALELTDSLTAAKTLGNTNALTKVSENAHVLFGFDAGRASIITDLHNLSIVPEEIKEVQPSYTTEF